MKFAAYNYRILYLMGGFGCLFVYLLLVMIIFLYKINVKMGNVSDIAPQVIEIQ